jgi:hypothetical protein
MADYIAAFGADNVFCFLHDPVCFNVGRRSLGLTEAEYGKMLAELHGRNFRKLVGSRNISSTIFWPPASTARAF